MNKDILNKIDLKIDKVSIRGKSIMIDTDNNRYVVKENDSNYYEYLPVRGFINFPEIFRIGDNYLVSKYINDQNIPVNQRLEDMIHLVSILHNHTSYEKKIDIDTIKEKYETIVDRLDNLMKYYLSLEDYIIDEEYMSPSNYLLIRNISLIYYSIKEARKYLDRWYKKIEISKSIRYVYTHGNLDRKHFLEDDKFYLISWDKSKIDLPIYDIEDFYKKNFKYIKLDHLLEIYSKKYPLMDLEYDLLMCILLIPSKIDIEKKEYPKVVDISDMILYFEDTTMSLKNYSKKHDKKTDK